MKKARPRAQDRVWRALGDPSRREILDRLRGAPRTVGELCDGFAPRISRFGVMKHLRVLQQAGLVVARKQGRQTWNHLNAVPLRRVYERWVSRYESHWAGQMLSLERRIESGRDETGAAAMADQAPKLDSFHIEQELELSSPPKKVFAALLDVDGWWCHRTFDEGAPSHIRLEAHAGGRFYEIGAAGEAHYGTVQEISAPRRLRLAGPLGMGRLPVMSVYEFRLEAAGSGTRLKLTHRAHGLLDPRWREQHEKGWGELWKHLKALVEDGKRFSA
ncbi:Transcriptional repressor SdpR [Phycisphaerae bacterium RAS1]|nr:Transcriptional repressor SdpR [Phycisphaerae bacterium RAS1]